MKVGQVLSFKYDGKKRLAKVVNVEPTYFTGQCVHSKEYRNFSKDKLRGTTPKVVAEPEDVVIPAGASSRVEVEMVNLFNNTLSHIFGGQLHYYAEENLTVLKKKVEHPEFINITQYKNEVYDLDVNFHNNSGNRLTLSFSQNDGEPVLVEGQPAQNVKELLNALCRHYGGKFVSAESR